MSSSIVEVLRLERDKALDLARQCKEQVAAMGNVLETSTKLRIALVVAERERDIALDRLEKGEKV